MKGYLLQQLIKRTLALRTHNTLLGWLWLYLPPLMQIVAFWFLLAVIFKVRTQGDYPFLSYFLTGMLIWLMWADCLLRSSHVLLEFSHFYQKNQFPIYLLPLLPLITGLMIYLPVYILLCLWLHGWQITLMILSTVLVLSLSILPLCYLIAISTVFLRDIGQALSVIMTFILYLTPVFYKPDALPASMQAWLWINPFADMMRVLHWPASQEAVPWLSLVRLSLLTGIGTLLACQLYRRAVPHLREYL